MVSLISVSLIFILYFEANRVIHCTTVLGTCIIIIEVVDMFGCSVKLRSALALGDC